MIDNVLALVLSALFFVFAVGNFWLSRRALEWEKAEWERLHPGDTYPGPM